MSIHEVLLAKCEVCSGENMQIKSVFKQLYGKLRLLLASSHFSHEPAGSISDIDGFTQLLRVLIVAKDLKTKHYAPCKHLRIFKMLQKSLNCNSQTLDYLCEITAAKIAERNYSLALLETQIKNTAHHLSQEMLLEPPLAAEVKEEPKFSSLRTLPSQREIKEEAEEVVAGEVLSFPFYCQFPFFFGGQ